MDKSNQITGRQSVGLVLFIAVVQVALQLSLLARGVEYLAASLTIDDTYYYLQTAWNTKQLGFVTFDGLHSTNGVQLSWFLIILLLAWVAKTKIVLLVSTLAVSFLLNGLCHIFIVAIGAVLKRPALAIILAGLWALQSLPFRIYSIGMENSLHALVFWCVIWQSLIFFVRTQKRERPNFWGLTLVLVLNAWTRLDSGLLSAILYIGCVANLARTHRQDLSTFLAAYGKVTFGSSLLAGIGLLIQLSLFRLMGGSFLPVSALVKTDGVVRGFSTAAVDKLAEVWLLGTPSIVQGRLPSIVLAVVAASAILVLGRAQWAKANQLSGLKPILTLWSCLAVGELIYHTYIAISGVQYTLYFNWYRSPSFIFWILTISLTILLALDRLELARPVLGFLRWAPIGIGVLSFSAAVYLFARSVNFVSELYSARYQAALWIGEKFPEGTIFAAWNTGQLGFFSNRRFVNLDGVINNVDYYERVLRGSTPIAAYLLENNVDYIVDYQIYAPVPNYPVIHAFPIDDDSGRSIQIWQVAPQVTSAP